MNNRFTILICFILCVASCQRNPYKVDVSDMKVDLDLQRFELDLFNLDLDRLDTDMIELQQRYTSFLTLFGYLINIGDPQNPAYMDFMKAFITDRVNYEVFQKTLEVFPDLTQFRKDLTLAFKYYRYHFPEKNIPDVFTFISGFNTSILVDTNVLAIGLDRYLGTDYKYYGQIGIPNYIRINMIPEKILSDCLYAWGSTEFSFEGNTGQQISNNVLNNILYEGKLRYFVKSMIPDEEDHLIMGFTPEQLQWCIANEGAMWTYLVENKLLFNTDHLTIRKLTGDAPFTSFFPKESPGKAAAWLGWRIILGYMERHPEVSLKELMNNTNYQDILNDAKYNPE